MCNLKSHLRKKNICLPVLKDISREKIFKTYFVKETKEFECKYCDKSFSHRSTRSHHEKSCSKKDILEKVKTMENEIYNMTKLINELQTKSSGNTTINNYNTVNNNNNININAYGTYKPTINYTQLEKLLNIGAYKAIKLLIDTNHFNKEKPENMNFYISNYKDNIGRIFDGESWVIKDGDHLVDEIYDLYQSLVDSAIEELQEVSENEEEQKNKLVERMNNTIELWCKRTNNNKFINGIKEDLKKHFHGKKDIVKKVHKIK
jgi:hypothetical protein